MKIENWLMSTNKDYESLSKTLLAVQITLGAVIVSIIGLVVVKFV